MFKSSWKTLTTRIVYQNPWVRMHEHNVVRPNGSKGIYGFLEIPDGVGIVAVSNNGKIQLIGEWRYPIGRHSWSIICGTREKDETPLQCAKRELAEEANMRSRKWKSLGIIHPSPGLVKETAFLYLAFGCQPIQKAVHKPEETEKFIYQEVTMKQALTMIKQGKISDSYAVCGIFLAKQTLGL